MKKEKQSDLLESPLCTTVWTVSLLHGSRPVCLHTTLIFLSMQAVHRFAPKGIKCMIWWSVRGFGLRLFCGFLLDQPRNEQRGLRQSRSTVRLLLSALPISDLSIANASRTLWMESPFSIYCFPRLPRLLRLAKQVRSLIARIRTCSRLHCVRPTESQKSRITMRGTSEQVGAGLSGSARERGG